MKSNNVANTLASLINNRIDENSRPNSLILDSVSFGTRIVIWVVQ